VTEPPFRLAFTMGREQLTTQRRTRSRHRFATGIGVRWGSIAQGVPAMAKRTHEPTAEASTETLAEGTQAAEKIMKGNAEALAESGNATKSASQELTEAYMELAKKNAKNLAAAMQALASVKSPAEFIELQKQLIKDGVEAAVRDSQHIAQLTTTVFTAAFEPVKKQIEAMQKFTRT
jgi:phasin family protein